MNKPELNPNIARLASAAEKLEPLLGQIVFVGGCVTGLLLTDPAASPVRPTLDVDAIIAIGSYPEFIMLKNRLRELGFHQPHTEGAPICRWMIGDLILDLMPTDASLLGFGNSWYHSALENAQLARVGRYEIRVITAPYFLATKLAAFHGRGKNDFRMSHDLEDICHRHRRSSRTRRRRSPCLQRTCGNTSAMSLGIYYRMLTFWKHYPGICCPTRQASSVSTSCWDE